MSMLLIVASAVLAFVVLAVLITRSAIARSERREFASGDSGYAVAPSEGDASVSASSDGCTSSDFGGGDWGGGDGGGGGD